jgi:hypothetical protein
MKQTQRGFIVPLVIIIIAALAVGGGVYYSKNKNKSASAIPEVETVAASNEVVKDNTAANTTPSSEWEVYTNNTFKFSIKYPSTWLVEYTVSASAMQKVTFSDPKSSSNKWSININKESYKSKDKLLEQMSTLFKSEKPVVSTISINGLQATKMEIAGTNVHTIHVVTSGSGSVYDITGKEGSDFELFYSSFTLLK